MMDVDVFFGSKSEEEDIMDFEMDEGTEYNILDKSEIENIQTDPGFQRAVSNIICSDLNDYGFQVCQQDRITSDTTTQQPPSSSTDITSLFEERDEDDDNESDENEDEDNGDGDDEDNN